MTHKEKFKLNIGAQRYQNVSISISDIKKTDIDIKKRSLSHPKVYDNHFSGALAFWTSNPHPTGCPTRLPLNPGPLGSLPSAIMSLHTPQPQARCRTCTARILKDIPQRVREEKGKGKKEKNKRSPLPWGRLPLQVTAVPEGQRSVHGLREPHRRHEHQHSRYRVAVHPPGIHTVTQGETALEGMIGEGCAFENVPPFTSLMGKSLFSPPPISVLTTPGNFRSQISETENDSLFPFPFLILRLKTKTS